MATLIKVGCLVMTPEQFQRALAEDMTVSQAQEMIRRENAESDTEKVEEENV